MESYFAMIRGVEMGPYTMQDLSSMLMRGEVNSETMVRKPDGAWFKLSSIPALFSTKEWLVALLLSLFLGYFGVDQVLPGPHRSRYRQTADRRRLWHLVAR